MTIWSKKSSGYESEGRLDGTRKWYVNLFLNIIYKTSHTANAHYLPIQFFRTEFHF